MTKFRILKLVLCLRGFSLVEVLVGAAILSLFVAGIYAVLNIGNMTYSTDLCLLDLQQNSRQAMYWLVKELRQANVASINIAVIDSDDDRISFSTPNDSGIQYYRDTSDINSDGITDQIIREFPAGSYRIVATEIGSLQFSLSGTVLEIELTADNTVLRRDLSLPWKAKLYLRNG